MSSMPVKPASTRLEIGQETNAASRSMRTTSILGSHMRMYLAAVAPPKPPPITTTRAVDGAGLAHPLRDTAPASFKKSRRFMPSPLLAGEPRRHRIDLRVAIALGDLVHHGGRALAVAEGPHLGCGVLARQPGERD